MYYTLMVKAEHMFFWGGVGGGSLEKYMEYREKVSEKL
jgi:hypothetical protein